MRGGQLYNDGTDVYRAFFEDAPDAVVVVDRDGRIVEANGRVTVLFGYDRSELVGQLVEVLLPERFRVGHTGRRAQFDKHPAKRPMGAGLDLWGRRKDGTEFPVDVSLSRAATGETQVTLAALRDVTERRRAEEELRASEQRFRMVFEDAPFGVAVIDRHQRLRQVNDSLCQLLGFDHDDLSVRTLADLTPAEDVTRYEQLLDQLFGGDLEHFSIEKRFLTRGGRVVWAEVTFSALGYASEADWTAVAMIEDITDRKQAEARLTHLATHDELTDLANRSLLADRVRQAQARSARSGQLFAVLFIDLDGFKRVNDDLGHATGDAVLAEVGHRIEAAVRPVDTAARHGGDEFVVCCEDLGVGVPEARTAIELVVARLLDALGEPVVTPSHTIPMTACIGVALARGDDGTPAALIAMADAAMYEAKSRGHGRSAFADDVA